MNDWLSHGLEFGSEIELVAFAVLAIVALLTPRGVRERLGAWESSALQPFFQLARRPIAAALACGLAPLGIRAALWPLLKYPVPGATDEYSYLLAADTFARGRLTNPTHPLWPFFETFQVIPIPTYASKYPPLQGLVLAAGQVLAGHAWWGAYASIGVMSAALYWALAGWVPRRWAMLGSFVALLQWEVLSYWMNSYWGGALAATGGALLLGGFPRLAASLRRRSPSRSTWLVLAMAAGAMILANTRPYEGLMLAAPIAIAAVWRCRALITARVVAPACLLIAATAGAMLYYNWRVTGNALLMPYVVHERRYAISPSFIFLPPRPEPASNHPIMAAWWRRERDAYDMARSAQFPRYVLNHAYMMFIFFLGPALLAAYLALWRGGRMFRGCVRWLLALLALEFVAILLVAGNMPHYAAPSTALMLLLAVFGLRRMPRRFAYAAVGAIAVRAVLCLPAYYWIPASHRDFSDYYRRCCIDNNANFDRANIEQRLAGLPHRQLVVVQYVPQQSRFKEYVSNGADIDSQRVIWARSMGPVENLRLFEYYPDRDVWLLTMYPDHGEIYQYSPGRVFEPGH